MNPTEYRGRARSATRLVFAQRVISFLLNVGQIAVLSRLIEPNEFGLVAIALFFSTLFSVFRDFGLPSAAIQLPRLDHDQRDALFWFNVFGTLLLITVFLICAEPIAHIYREPRLAPILAIAAISFLLLGLSAQHAALLRRELDFRSIFVSEVGGLLIGWISTVVLAYLYRNAFSLVIGSAIQAAFTALSYVVLGGWFPRLRVHLKSHLQLLNFGANIATFSALNFISNNVAGAFLGFSSGTAAAGLFSRAQSLYTLPNSFLLGPYLQVQFPLLCRIAHSDALVKKEYGNILALSGLIFFSVGLTLPFISHDLIVILLGPPWKEVASILSCFSPALLALGFIAPFGQFMTSQGRVRELRIWSVAELFIRGGGAILGSLLGPRAAAAGFSAATLFATAPIIIWLTARKGPVSVSDQLKAAIPGLIVAVCTTSITFLSMLLLDHAGVVNEITRLSITVAALLIAWSSATLAIPESRTILHSLIKREGKLTDGIQFGK